MREIKRERKGERERARERFISKSVLLLRSKRVLWIRNENLVAKK